LFQPVGALLVHEGEDLIDAVEQVVLKETGVK
jgi:hypothetical protein